MQLSAVWEWEDGGFDRVGLTQTPAGWHVSGRHGETRYVLTLDPAFRCLTLEASCGEETCSLTRTPLGWLDAQGAACPGGRDAVDLDLGWSAVTNTFPIRRLMAEGRDSGEFEVLLITLPELTVVPARQSYHREADGWRYTNATSGFSALLKVDKNGLVTDYPGLCTRRT